MNLRRAFQKLNTIWLNSHFTHGAAGGSCYGPVKGSTGRLYPALGASLLPLAA